MDLYSSLNIVRVIKQIVRDGGTWNTCGERRGAYRFLVEKYEGERPLGRFRRRWEDDIKMYLQ